MWWFILTQYKICSVFYFIFFDIIQIHKYIRIGRHIDTNWPFVIRNYINATQYTMQEP